MGGPIASGARRRHHRRSTPTRASIDLEVSAPSNWKASPGRRGRREAPTTDSGALWKFAKGVGPAHLGATTYPGMLTAETHDLRGPLGSDDLPMKTIGLIGKDQRGEHDRLLPAAHPPGARAAGWAALVRSSTLLSLDFAPIAAAAGPGRTGTPPARSWPTRRGSWRRGRRGRLRPDLRHHHAPRTAPQICAGASAAPVIHIADATAAGAEGEGRDQGRCCWRRRSPLEKAFYRGTTGPAEPGPAGPGTPEKGDREAGCTPSSTTSWCQAWSPCADLQGRGAGAIIALRPGGRLHDAIAFACTEIPACCWTPPPCRCRRSTPQSPTARRRMDFPLSWARSRAGSTARLSGRLRVTSHRLGRSPDRRRSEDPRQHPSWTTARLGTGAIDRSEGTRHETPGKRLLLTASFISTAAIAGALATSAQARHQSS